MKKYNRIKKLVNECCITKFYKMVNTTIQHENVKNKKLPMCKNCYLDT